MLLLSRAGATWLVGVLVLKHVLTQASDRSCELSIVLQTVAEATLNWFR